MIRTLLILLLLNPAVYGQIQSPQQIKDKTSIRPDTWIHTTDPRTGKTGFITFDQIGKARIDSIVGSLNNLDFVKYSDTAILLNPYRTGLLTRLQYSDSSVMLSAYRNALNSKQATLQNTINIRSVNGQSLLGSGNINFTFDTAGVFTNYQSAINARLRYTDTSSMMVNYRLGLLSRVLYADTASMLSAYRTAFTNVAKTNVNNNFAVGQNITGNLLVSSKIGIETSNPSNLLQVGKTSGEVLIGGYGTAPTILTSRASVNGGPLSIATAIQSSANSNADALNLFLIRQGSFVGGSSNLNFRQFNAGDGAIGDNILAQIRGGRTDYTVEVQGNGFLSFSTAANGATSPTERMRITADGKIIVASVTEYTDNAAAISAGLSVGTIYRTGDALKIVH